jgi:RNA polymerase sigma-54 factor
LLASDSTPPETRDYIKDKIRRAAFLINSLGQRQSTLERIARAIVDAQEAFFKNGIDAMRPLTMGEVAQKIGVHETTVSRGVAAKYLECKFGLVPMRQFFSNGYCDSEGRDVSNIAVKNAVRRFVENEDPHRPLSDSCIAERLRRSGLNVARRTVAKYRESMGILSSKLRRQYW